MTTQTPGPHPAGEEHPVTSPSSHGPRQTAALVVEQLPSGETWRYQWDPDQQQWTAELQSRTPAPVEQPPAPELEPEP